MACSEDSATTASVSSEDTFLSDVHVGVKTLPGIEEGTVISRFVLSLHDVRSVPLHDDKPLNSQGYVDEDGDMVIPRRMDLCGRRLLLIEHALSTRLCDVGQQVWRGALALADFLLYHKDTLQNSVMLELGGGVGLVSIVASQFCKAIFCTDVDTQILEICQRNIERNIEPHTRSDVLVRELNWHTPFTSSCDSKFQWQHSDEKWLEEVQYIIAADVVYEDKLTEAFMQCLILLNYSKLKSPAVIYLAIEKRINFTLEELAPAIPAYDYFRRCLLMAYHTECGDAVQVEATHLDLSEIPQYLNYERVKEIELWKLRTHKRNES